MGLAREITSQQTATNNSLIASRRLLLASWTIDLLKLLNGIIIIILDVWVGTVYSPRIRTIIINRNSEVTTRI